MSSRFARFAPVNTDGSLGTWSETAALPVNLELHGVEVWDGTLYALGGIVAEPTESKAVYSAPINLDGSVGAWTQRVDLPYALTTAFGGRFAAHANGKLYLVGGRDTAATGGRATVYSSGVTRNAPAGTYFNAFDFGSDLTLLDVAFTATLNGGGVSVFISTASGTSAFSSWAPVTPGVSLNTASVRHLRYRVELAPSSGGATPVFEDLTARVQ